MQNRYVVVVIFAAVVFLDRLDLTIVNITLPTIANDLSISITETEWVNTAYILALVASIPISSYLGDRFGVKRIFNTAIIIFGFASFCCAYSNNIISLSLFRCLQGVGGGLIVPVGMSLVYQSFAKSQYASITSYIFMSSLVAPAIAPALGGVVTELYGWRWVFLFVIPICILASILTVFFVKDIGVKSKRIMNWRGFAYSIISIISIFYLISIIGNKNLGYSVFLFLIAAILSTFLFIRNEKRSLNPLIHLYYLKKKIFLQANLIQTAFQISHYGSIFLISLYLQVSAGMPVELAGLIMGMQAVGAFSAHLFSAKLFDAFGPRLPLLLGLGGLAILTPCIMLIQNKEMITVGLIVLFARGLFGGLCGMSVQTLGVIGFKNQEISRASALFSIGRQLAIALGISISSVLLNICFRINNLNFDHNLKDIDVAIFIIPFLFVSVVCIFGLLVVFTINNDKVKSYMGG